MSGRRLAVGFLVMGVMVPLVLLYLLHLNSVREFITIAATCFFSWCIADLIANLLSRPRLQNRSPSDALREWEQQKLDEGDL